MINGFTPVIAIIFRVAMCMAPCQMEVQIKIDKAPDFRIMEIVVDAEDSDYFRLSEWKPESVYLTYKEVPGGHYNLTVTIFDNYGQVAAKQIRSFIVSDPRVQHKNRK